MIALMPQRPETIIRHDFIRCEFRRLSRLYPHWKADYVMSEVAKKAFVKVSTVEKILKMK